MAKLLKPENVLPITELPDIAAVEDIARDMFAQRDAALQEDFNALEHYEEWYFENLSEAGYSETRPNDRLATRAFARLLRVKPDEFKQLKDLLGWDRTSVYRDFGLCDALIDALSRNEELAL